MIIWRVVIASSNFGLNIFITFGGVNNEKISKHLSLRCYAL